MAQFCNPTPQFDRSFPPDYLSAQKQVINEVAMPHIILSSSARAFQRDDNNNKFLYWRNEMIQKGETLEISDPEVLIYDHSDKPAVRVNTEAGIRYLLVEEVPELKNVLN